jgi:hypothetical protein
MLEFTESYPGSGTTWTDLSGVGNNGTLTNGPTFNSDNGGSILFDGVDDYAVTSPTNFTANNDFTYEIIVKSNQYIQSRGIFGNKGYWMAGQGAVIGNISSPQTIYGYVTTNTGHFDINSNVGPTYGWTNVVMRRSNNDLRFFINGNHQGSTRTISGTVTDLSDKFWLGSYVIGVQAVTPWLGNMAISRVYNRALTSSEILQNYYQAPIVTDGLVYAIDASNLVSYESGSITSYSLTGSNTGYLRYGTEFTSNNGGTFKFGTNRNTTVQAVSASNYTSSPINLPGYGSYSINVWVKRTAFGTWKSGNTNYDGIWNYYWDHNLAFTGEHTGINGIYGTGLNAYAINMNQWYNIMVTHKDYSIQNTNNHKTYLNGVLISTATITNPTLDGGLPKRFYIGNWDTSWSMVGEMANFQVYNKELSVAEIDQNFNAYRGKFGV